ncbi:MAG: response regulator transcription factor [Bacteroidota bacterium]
MIKLLIVDDHQVLLDGLKSLFRRNSSIEVCASALSGKQAVAIAKKKNIDLVLLDINLPDINGFEVCKQLKVNVPQIKVLALSMYQESGYISNMIKAGADGYIFKDAASKEMESAIDAIMNGQKYFSAEVTQCLVAGMHRRRKPKSTDFIQKLTFREKEILQLIIDEYTNDEIAKKLFISKTTVATHRNSLLRKLNAKNTAGLVKTAYEFGLLEES